MHVQVPDRRSDQRQFTITFHEGDEVVRDLQRFARDHALQDATIRGHGAVADAVLGHWDPLSGLTLETRYSEQMEVASLTGHVAPSSTGVPEVRLHVVLGRRDHTTRAGRLHEAHARPALTVLVAEAPPGEPVAPTLAREPVVIP